MGFNARRGTPTTTSYLFQAVDFGGGSDLTELIQGPAGKYGRVVGVDLFNISETFVGTTSGGGVAVGDGTDPTAYYDSGLLLLVGSSPAINTGLWMPDTVASIEIPADQALTVTFTACVGGSVTGIADVHLIIDWYDSTGYAGKSVAG
jgi:hypothetical protein